MAAFLAGRWRLRGFDGRIGRGDDADRGLCFLCALYPSATVARRGPTWAAMGRWMRLSISLFLAGSAALAACAEEASCVELCESARTAAECKESGPWSGCTIFGHCSLSALEDLGNGGCRCPQCEPQGDDCLGASICEGQGRCGPGLGFSPKRDAAIERIAEVGRRQWRKESGAHQQARAENAMLRYKRIIGDGLRRWGGFSPPHPENLIHGAPLMVDFCV